MSRAHEDGRVHSGWARSFRPSEPATVLTALALLAITVAAWAALLLPSVTGAPGAAMAPPTAEPGMADPGMPMSASAGPHLLGALAFVSAWVVMMAAMMVPSATPMILLYRATATGSPARRTTSVAVFVATYLVVWAVFGLLVYVAQVAVTALFAGSPSFAAWQPVSVAGVLIAAGLYQFSAVKSICLRQCRSPISFLMERWRPGLVGALRLGTRHGIYCLGCCWGLMAVLLVAGAMGLAWVALIAFVVFAEKVLPGGTLTSRLVGIALLALGASVLFAPDLAGRILR